MIEQRIKEIREENHLTQKDFGKSLDLRPVQISRYERGEQSPFTQALTDLEDYYTAGTIPGAIIAIVE